MFEAAVTGYFTALSLIMAIGAQNAFVLRQGIARQHVFWVALFCASSDMILISSGVAGFGALVTLTPWLPFVMAVFGAGFLLVYGGLRFRAAIKGVYAMTLENKTVSLGKTIAIAAAFTWLNPHVYLDTLGLIGAVSTQFVPVNQKIAFAVAASIASYSFFFSLGYGARLLAPVMQSARAWQVLDGIIGVVMWGLAVMLVLSVL